MQVFACSYREDAESRASFAEFYFTFGPLISVSRLVILSGINTVQLGPLGRIIMQWTAPAFEEVCLNCEINSYASAKLQ